MGTLGECRALSLVGILHIATQLLRAIEHMHRQGLAHCDIKPDNVLLRTSAAPPPASGLPGEAEACIMRRLKLCDFGEAKPKTAERQCYDLRCAAVVLWLVIEQRFTAADAAMAAAEGVATSALTKSMARSADLAGDIRGSEVMERLKDRRRSIGSAVDRLLILDPGFSSRV